LLNKIVKLPSKNFDIAFDIVYHNLYC